VLLCPHKEPGGARRSRPGPARPPLGHGPRPGGPGMRAYPELLVLAVLTRALDLDQDSSRRLVLSRLASLDGGHRGLH